MSITIKPIAMRFFEELSHEVAQFTIITGRRRIGKTEMVKKFYENKMIHILICNTKICEKSDMVKS